MHLFPTCAKYDKNRKDFYFFIRIFLQELQVENSTFLDEKLEYSTLRVNKECTYYFPSYFFLLFGTQLLSDDFICRLIT